METASQSFFEPFPELSDGVKSCWIYENSQAGFSDSDILPDPYAQLIVNFGAPYLYEAEDGSMTELPNVFINGLQSKPLRLKVTGTVQHVAISLYPWMVDSLVETPIRIADTTFIALGGVWDDLAQSIGAIVAQRGYHDTITYVQQFVSSIQQHLPADLIPIRRAGELLYASNGQVRMHELAAHCYLSPSQFERQFKRLVGLSPKAFARLIRFDALVESLMANPRLRANDLAYDFGFSDQAHLIHEFKCFADRTPGEFATQVQSQDAAFLQYV